MKANPTVLLLSAILLFTSGVQAQSITDSSRTKKEKKYKALDKWLTTHISSHYIMLDPEVATCPLLKKWADAARTFASN